jgi:hypothetical protein
MGEVDLGLLDIPTCDERVKKSFQTRHSVSPVSDILAPNRPYK